MAALRDQVAVVTGGGKGIGRAIVAALAQEGASVAVCGRDQAALDVAATAIGPRARTYAFDVRSLTECDAAFSRIFDDFGRTDILVNSAGITGHTPIAGGDPDVWTAVVETNLTGTWNCVRAAGPRFPHDGPGRIVSISSVLGKFGVAERSAYCASKHGVIGLTRAIALELAPRRITANAICPGWVDTEMARASMAATAQSLGLSAEEFRRQALAEVPQQRMIEPEEVAALVVYLCRPEAHGITGQAISVCGGQTAF